MLCLYTCTHYLTNRNLILIYMHIYTLLKYIYWYTYYYNDVAQMSSATFMGILSI